MPLNTDPTALTDAQYYAGMQEMAERVGDAGLHTSAEAWLIEHTSYERSDNGQDR